MKKYDAVIIGSGVSGLTTALILGQHGKKIAILEQFSNINPLLRRFRRADNWCDPGFHYTGGLNPGGSLDVLLDCIGIKDKIKPIPLPADGFDIISANDEYEYLLPYGYDRLEDYLSSKFPSSRSAIKQYINALIQINKETAFTNLDLDLDQFSVSVYENQSLAEFLKKSGAKDDLIRVLGNHGYVLYGSPGTEVPMPVHSYIMGSFYNSCSTVFNGGDAFVNAFEKQIEKFDIDVFTNHKVSEIELGSGREVKAVKTADGEYFESSTCISTIHPKNLIDILPESGVRPAFVNRIKKLQNTPGSLVLFIDSDKYPERLLNTNFYHFNDKLNGGKDTDYLACMATHPNAETRGRRSLTVIKPIDSNLFKDFFGKSYYEYYDDYVKLKNDQTEKVFSEFLDLIPELKGHARVVDSATPVTYNRYTQTDKGSMYGTRQSIQYRSLSSRTSVHGLYLAGQSLQLGVMGAVVSGFMAATHIIDVKVLQEQIRKCL